MCVEFLKVFSASLTGGGVTAMHILLAGVALQIPSVINEDIVDSVRLMGVDNGPRRSRQSVQWRCLCSGDDQQLQQQVRGRHAVPEPQLS